MDFQKRKRGGAAAGGVNAQLLSRGATVACSGHVMGPAGSTRWSLGAFVGVGSRGDATLFSSVFFVLRGHPRILSPRRRADGCRLETPSRVHNGVYYYGRKEQEDINVDAGSNFRLNKYISEALDFNKHMMPHEDSSRILLQSSSKSRLRYTNTNTHSSTEISPGQAQSSLSLSAVITSESTSYYQTEHNVCRSKGFQMGVPQGSDLGPP